MTGSGESWSERLTALDAAFLDLEGPTAPMHVGSVSIFEGKRSDAERTRRPDRLPNGSRAALRPAPRARSLQRRPSCLGRRSRVRSLVAPPASEAAPARKPTAAPRSRRHALRPSSRSRQASLGDLGRRGARGAPVRGRHEDPSLHDRRRLRSRPRLRPPGRRPEDRAARSAPSPKTASGSRHGGDGDRGAERIPAAPLRPGARGGVAGDGRGAVP